MKPTFLTIASPSHCSKYSSAKQPQTPSMLISIHSPLTRRLSLPYSYVRSPLLQVNLSIICLSYANVCWNPNHIIIVLVLMLVSIHSFLLALPSSSSFSSIYSNHNSPLIFLFPLFFLFISLSKPVPFSSQLRGYKKRGGLTLNHLTNVLCFSHRNHNFCSHRSQCQFLVKYPWLLHMS